MTRQYWKSGLLLVGVMAVGAGCEGNGQLASPAGQSEAIESSEEALKNGNVVNFEAENASPSASSIGFKVTSETAASGGKYVEFAGTATGTGQWIEFNLANIQAGPYDIKFLFKSNTNRGVVQASIDGSPQGSTCSEYASRAAYKVACSLGSKTLSAGNHKIRFTVTGKGQGNGYQMTVDQISLTFKGECTANSDCTGGKTCSNNQCVCPSGQTSCSGTCRSLTTDPSNCGACGNVCSAGKTCVGGSCQSACQGVYVCNSCLAWNFESGTTQAWTAKTSNCSVGVAAGAGLGSYSLSVNSNSPDGSTIEVTVPLCGNGASIVLPTAGYQFNARVKFQSSIAFGSDGLGGGRASILVEGENYYNVLYDADPIATNQWISLSGPIVARTPTNPSHLTLRFFPWASWSGVIYVDNVSVN
jgi:hypothetical protein